MNDPINATAAGADALAAWQDEIASIHGIVLRQLTSPNMSRREKLAAKKALEAFALERDRLELVSDKILAGRLLASELRRSLEAARPKFRVIRGGGE